MGSWNLQGGHFDRGQRGSTLVVMILLLFATLGLTISALRSASSGLTITRNYRTGSQAFLAAEAGILHAQKRIDDFGPIRFDNDVVDDWAVIFGTGERTMPGKPSVSYRVTVANDLVDPTNFMLMVANGLAPEEASRAIRVRLQRSGTFSPGAIYMPDPSATATFNGNQFLVDGYDTDLSGAPNTNDPVPGIGTFTASAANDVRGAISLAQEDNVIGLGGSESVLQSAGPSVPRLETEIVPGILARPGIVMNPALTGNDTFGSIGAPQVTYFTGDLAINGTMSGAGILIVDGAFRITGDADFAGLIIVRGETEITTFAGNATLLGALWTTAVDLNVSGSASITYSSEALALANGIVGAEDLLPQKVEAVSWHEL